MEASSPANTAVRDGIAALLVAISVTGRPTRSRSEAPKRMLTPTPMTAALEPAVSPLVAYAVLAIAFALEGGSTVAAFREFDRTRRGQSWWQALTSTKDATTVIVLL